MGYRGGGGGYGSRGGGGGFRGRGGGGGYGSRGGGGGFRGRGGGGGYGDRGPVEMHPVKCADCGTDTQVPFKPTQDRPVYCRDCYQKQRGDRGGDRGGYGGRGRGGGYGGRGGGGGGYGGRGGGDRFSRPAPNASVREGEVYEVDITEVGNKGDGITRVENFVVFVPGAQKGDRVKIRIREVMQRFAVAEVDSGEATSDSGEPAKEPPAEEAGPNEESEGGDSEEDEK